MPKYLRVVPKEDKWAVELDGEEQAVYDSEQEAEQQGRKLASEKGAEFKSSIDGETRS